MVEFKQYDSAAPNPSRFVLRVPVGQSEIRRMMDRKDAEELMAQMVFVLGYKIDLEGP